jgi:hypothetical protein
MKPHLIKTVKRLNVEHRTFNFERPILMALRFIYLKQANRYILQGGQVSKSRFARAAQALAPRVAWYFFKSTEYSIRSAGGRQVLARLWRVGRSMFDVP